MFAGVGAHELQEVTPTQWIQVGERFVKEQDRRPSPKGEREGHLRLLPTRQPPNWTAQVNASQLETPGRKCSIKARAPLPGDSEVLGSAKLRMEVGTLRNVAYEARTMVLDRVCAVNRRSAG